MIIIDIFYYLSWLYLTSVIIVEMLIFDLPAYFYANNKKNKLNKAFEYYKHRHKIPLYKIIPIFCLFIVAAIIGNIVVNYNEFLTSAIAILVLAFLLVAIQTKKNINVVAGMKKDNIINHQLKQKGIKSIFFAHLVTLIILIAMLFLYVFKF